MDETIELFYLLEMLFLYGHEMKLLNSKLFIVCLAIECNKERKTQFHIRNIRTAIFSENKCRDEDVV